LAISAISRIDTNFCKQFIKSKLCEINNYWPVEKIENNCDEYFGLCDFFNFKGFFLKI